MNLRDTSVYVAKRIGLVLGVLSVVVRILMKGSMTSSDKLKLVGNSRLCPNHSQKRNEMSEEKSVLVACYGSLRRDMGNFRVNEMAGGEFVSMGKTKDNHNLYKYCGGFPSVSLAHSDNGTPVVVDVFKTTEEGLKGAYDGLEGHRGNDNPHTFYKRTQIPVTLDSGEEVQAWIYHIDEETGPVVESGDWCLFKNPDYYKTV